MSSSTQQPSPTNKLGEQELCIDCQPEVPSQADSLRSGSSIIQVEAVKSSQTPDEEEQGQKKEDLMDPTTFIPPISTHADTNLPRPMIIVEYCQRCKFGLRANWIQQELLSTFSPTNNPSNTSQASIASVLVIPKIDDASAGKFRIYLLPTTHTNKQESTPYHTYPDGLVLLWDRKVQAGFPEMRILKQKVRDLINPNFSLGHSDKN